MSIVKKDIERIASYGLSWDKLDGKTVAVTGATGFIGSFIIKALLQRVKDYGEDISIVAFVRNEQRAKEKFRDYEDLGRIEYIEQDICESVTSPVRADYVIHCASNAAPDMYMKDPVGTMRINFLGTDNMLRFAERSGAKKFLYVSTIEVYGKTSCDEITEDDFGYISSGNVRSCYPESKKCCENLTICFGKQYGLNVSVGRLSYIYGAGMSKTDAKVCALFARKVAAGEDIVLKSEGKQLRSYTYVSDAITGLFNKARCEFFLGDFDSLKATVKQYESALNNMKKLYQKAKDAYNIILKTMNLLVAISEENKEAISNFSGIEVWNNSKATQGYINYLKGIAAYMTEDKKEAIYRFMSVKENCEKTVFAEKSQQYLLKMSAEA